MAVIVEALVPSAYFFRIHPRRLTQTPLHRSHFQSDNLSLPRPLIGIRRQTRTHWILSYVFPFFSIAVAWRIK